MCQSVRVMVGTNLRWSGEGSTRGQETCSSVSIDRGRQMAVTIASLTCFKFLSLLRHLWRLVSSSIFWPFLAPFLLFSSTI